MTPQRDVLTYVSSLNRVEITEWLAAQIDPPVFDPTHKRSSHPAALIQWAARQHMAIEAATKAMDAFDVLIKARGLVCRRCNGYGILPRAADEPPRTCPDCAVFK